MEEWSGHPDLNWRPPAPKAGALPGCAMPRPEEKFSFYLSSSLCATGAEDVSRDPLPACVAWLTVFTAKGKCGLGLWEHNPLSRWIGPRKTRNTSDPFRASRGGLFGCDCHLIVARAYPGAPWPRARGGCADSSPLCPAQRKFSPARVPKRQDRSRSLDCPAAPP